MITRILGAKFNIVISNITKNTGVSNIKSYSLLNWISTLCRFPAAIDRSTLHKVEHSKDSVPH